MQKVCGVCGKRNRYPDRHSFQWTRPVSYTHLDVYKRQDQWDWEKIIGKEERTIDTLKTVVNQIYEVLKRTEMYVASFYPQIKPVLPKHITFVTTAELEDRYCGLTTKERERQIVKEHGAVFLMGIGGARCV